jgi:hypothetical protein
MSLYVKICEDWITNSWEINFHRLRRLCGTGCGGYVVLVAEAMWAGCGGYVGWLRRLCGAGCGGYVLD